MHTRFQLRKANILEVGYVMLMLYFFLKGMISLFMGNWHVYLLPLFFMVFDMYEEVGIRVLELSES